MLADLSTEKKAHLSPIYTASAHFIAHPWKLCSVCSFLCSVFHLTQVFVIGCVLMLDREWVSRGQCDRKRSPRGHFHHTQPTSVTEHNTGQRETRTLKNTKKRGSRWRCNRRKMAITAVISLRSLSSAALYCWSITDIHTFATPGVSHRSLKMVHSRLRARTAMVFNGLVIIDQPTVIHSFTWAVERHKLWKYFCSGGQWRYEMSFENCSLLRSVAMPTIYGLSWFTEKSLHAL